MRWPKCKATGVVEGSRRWANAKGGVVQYLQVAPGPGDRLPCADECFAGAKEVKYSPVETEKRFKPKPHDPVARK